MLSHLSRLALLLLCLGMIPIGSAEEPNNTHQMTTPIPDARYEIVVSSWLRRQTFRLDRYNGRVWQKVVSGEGDQQTDLWEEMAVDSRLGIPPANRPHFQIFLSGTMAADAFLIDTNSGTVWNLVKMAKKDTSDGSEGFMLWQIIPEEDQSTAPTSSPPQSSRRAPSPLPGKASGPKH